MRGALCVVALVAGLAVDAITPAPVGAADGPPPGTLLPAFGDAPIDLTPGGPHTLLLALNGRIARLDTRTTAVTTVANVTTGELAFDPTSGAVWFTTDYSIKRVDVDGSISTVVGDDDEPCFTGDCGDGGPASDARIGLFTRIGASDDGALWIADGRHLRRVDPDDGTIDGVVDDLPFGDIAVAPDGRVAAVDSQRIAVVEDGALRVLADVAARPPCDRSEDPCGDGGPLAAARFAYPFAVAWHGDDLFLSEASSVVSRIRRLGADGRITHAVGSFRQCLFGLGQCRLGTPAATTAIASAGNLAMVDGDLFFAESYAVLRVNAIDDAPEVDPQGYRMIASDGGVFTFGWAPFHGSTGGLRLASPIVAGRSTGATGYWFVAADGGVFAFGSAGFHGSAVGTTTSPVVDMLPTTTGAGYWLLERDTAFLKSYGDAAGHGPPEDVQPYAALVRGADGFPHQIAERPSSLPQLNRPIVAAHATRSGNGRWYVASDGGVFTEGDAGFFGSTGAMRLNQPVLDLVPTPSERGYWLIAADGGVFSFGDAVFLGSMGGVRLNRPVVAGMPGPDAT